MRERADWLARAIIAVTILAPLGCGRSHNACPGGKCVQRSSSKVTLTVSANPNSVLSAIATVSWTGPLSSVAISASGVSTPVTDLSSRTSPVTLPILGLKASTSYVFQATGTDAQGLMATSNQARFTSGALPSGVPVFQTTGTSSPGSYTLVARIPLVPMEDDYVTIVDGSGSPVWYYLLPPRITVNSDGTSMKEIVGMGADFQQQPDGTFTVAVDVSRNDQIKGLEETECTYNQVDVLGNVVHTWEALDTTDPKTGQPLKIAGTDCHEIRIQPDGSALLYGYVLETEDLTSAGGRASATVASSVLERITPDGRVLFAWDSSDYVKPTDLDPTPATVNASTVDYEHANAIDVLPDGNYLVSLRSMSSVMKVDSRDGHVIWTLGGSGIGTPSSHGPKGDFTIMNDPLGGFSCQHGAHGLTNGDILVFDDGNGHKPPESRAVEYQLDTTHMTATAVWYTQPSASLYTFLLGYAQRLSNGNTLVTYGVADQVQEFDPSGMNVVWSLTDTQGDNGTSGPFGLYRAYRIGSLYSYSPQ